MFNHWINYSFFSINTMKSYILLLTFLSLFVFSCKNEKEGVKQFPKESKFDHTETVPEASPEDKKGIEESLKGFTSWYQQNFSTLFTYEDIKGGTDKTPFRINWDGVNGALKELGKCPEFDAEFFENERIFYKKWEEKWKTNPETKQIPDVFQRDRYLCTQEPDLIFSLLEKAQIAVAVKGETATALINFENGTRLPFELKKREGRWKITRIICE